MLYITRRNTDNSNNKFSKNENNAVYSVRMRSVSSIKNRQESERYRKHDKIYIIMDNGLSEHFVASARYLGGMEKIIAMPVESADESKLNATQKGGVNVDIGVANRYHVWRISSLHSNSTSNLALVSISSG